MPQRFAYLYFMADEPERVGTTAPLHAAYWRELQQADYAGGPFADRSGGLITFTAADIEEAEAAVRSDPFITEGLITDRWLKRWEAKS